jgi:hypothetical protein
VIRSPADPGETSRKRRKGESAIVVVAVAVPGDFVGRAKNYLLGGSW